MNSSTLFTSRILSSRPVFVALALVLILPLVSGCLGKKQPDDRIVVRQTKGGTVVNANNMLKMMATLDLAGGKYERAEKSFSSVLKNRPDDVIALGGLSLALHSQKKYQAAEPILARYVTAARKSNDKFVGSSLVLSAENARKLHRLADARQFYEDALAWFEKQKNQKQIANVSFELGKLAAARRDFPTAIQHLTNAQNIYEQLKQMPRAAAVMRHRGEVLLSQKKLPEAESMLERSLTIHMLNARQAEAARTRVSLAEVLLEKGQEEQADKQYKAAVSAARESKKESVLALVLGNYARGLIKRKRYADAEAALSESTALFRKNKVRAGIALNNLQMGHLYFQQAKRGKACTHWQSAADLYRDMGAVGRRTEIEILLRLSCTADS